MTRALVYLITHLGAVALGFALGVYLLPIIAAPPAPSTQQVQAHRDAAMFTAQFTRDLKGSDTFHWGEGTVYVSRDKIALEGGLAPGPAYVLYLSPVFVDDEVSFTQHKDQMVAVADIKTFDNFLLDVPAWIDVTQYSSVVVWCEAFSEFITAAKFR